VLVWIRTWASRRRARRAWQQATSEPFDWALDSAALVPVGSPDEAFLGFARSWLENLAAGDWTAAVTTLLPGSKPWSPALLENVVTSYGRQCWQGDRERHHRPTAATPAPTTDHLRWLRIESEEESGTVDPCMPMSVVWFKRRPYDEFHGVLTTWIPLDGSWSDLSAEFDILEARPGLLGFRLGKLDVS
jgi:hypothetical protein